MGNSKSKWSHNPSKKYSNIRMMHYYFPGVFLDYNQFIDHIEKNLLHDVLDHNECNPMDRHLTIFDQYNNQKKIDNYNQQFENPNHVKVIYGGTLIKDTCMIIEFKLCYPHKIKMSINTLNQKNKDNCSKLSYDHTILEVVSKAIFKYSDIIA